MGTTFGSLHVYSMEPITGFENFRSFSPGWQTYLPQEAPEDHFELKKLAKLVSQRTDHPVLWFFIFDSESISFEFFRSGRKIAGYTGDTGKNIYAIPDLIGIHADGKRRLSKILNCADVDFQLSLLEEYFGLCLLPVPELYGEDAEAFVRMRSDKLYQAYLNEEKKITGRHSPICTELVWESAGKLFHHEFNGDVLHYRPGLYLFGYDTFESNFVEDPLRPVRFTDGQLMSITREEFDSAPKLRHQDALEDDRYCVEWAKHYQVHFTDLAPESFRGRTMIAPRGYYIRWFDDKDRVILSNDRGGIAVADESMSVIAKLRVKGIPIDYSKGFLLTVGSESGFAYCYHPNNYVRIYRLYDKS